jgi:anthranilate phosphoribosyltransferase
MGVYADSLVEPIGHVLRDLGAEHALVVHGTDGLDEITTTGPTQVVELRHGAIRSFTIAPEDFGIPRSDAASLKGGDAAANAQAIRGLLEGVKGPYRDIVLLNTAAALVIAERASDMPSALVLAADAIDTGKAKATLASLARITNSGQA